MQHRDYIILKKVLSEISVAFDMLGNGIDGGVPR